MALSRAWVKRATVNTDKTGYTSPIGPPCPGGMSVCLQDGPSGRVRSLHSICAATCVTSQWADVHPFWWVSPHSTAVRPIGVNGWGAVRAQDRNIGSK